MQMTFLGIPLGNLFSMWAVPNHSVGNHQSNNECQNKIWSAWYEKIDQMAKRRFYWDEALAMEAATYILTERLPKECETLLNQNSTFILLKISYWLEDFARKTFGVSTPLHRCIGKRPLYSPALQLILKSHLRKAEFYTARVIETLATDHPEVKREEIAKTVFAIKAYYLLAVYHYSRRETVEILKGETTMSSASVEEVVSEILQKCRIKIPPVMVSRDALPEDELEGLDLPAPDLPFEERVAEQWRQQLELAVLAYVLGNSPESVDDPEFQKLLNRLRDDPEFQNLLNRLQMAKLKELEKQVLRMRYYHDMTAKEIADSTLGRQQGWTERKVFTISDSALKKLSKVLPK